MRNFTFLKFCITFHRKEKIVQWSSETRSKLFCWNWIKSMDYFHLCEVMVISLLSIKGIDTRGPSAFRGRKKWKHSMFTLAIPAYRQQSWTINLTTSFMNVVPFQWLADCQHMDQNMNEVKKCSYIICTYVFLFCQVIKKHDPSCL